MSNGIVCVVDGDPAVRDSVETLMSLNGYAVAVYSTGSAFLSDFDPDTVGCVVCEAELPDTTGFAVYDVLRQRHCTAPFALLVSRGDRATYDRARRVGIDHVFTKPIVNRRLTAFVRAREVRKQLDKT